MLLSLLMMVAESHVRSVAQDRDGCAFVTSNGSRIPCAFGGPGRSQLLNTGF
jgi:hypothetical protein